METTQTENFYSIFQLQCHKSKFKFIFNFPPPKHIQNYATGSSSILLMRIGAVVTYDRHCKMSQNAKKILGGRVLFPIISEKTCGTLQRFCLRYEVFGAEWCDWVELPKHLPRATVLYFEMPGLSQESAVRRSCRKKAGASPISDLGESAKLCRSRILIGIE